MTISKYIALLLSALACCTAQASESLEVGVVGRLAPVNSCVPTLSSSQLDYGVLKASDLNRDKQTALPEKMITLTVACASLVNGLRVSFPDTKAADAIRDLSVVHHPLCAADKQCADFAFGLGRDGRDRKIGALFLRTRGATIDGKPTKWILVPGPLADGGTKVRDTLFSPRERANGGAFSYGYVPSVFDSHCRPLRDGSNCYKGQNFSIPIGINPVIDSKDREVSGEMRLNGAFSVEIQML